MPRRALGQVGVQFEEFGTRLNFLPIVLGNGKIHLEVEPEVSRLNRPAARHPGHVVPGRDTQRVHTVGGDGRPARRLRHRRPDPPERDRRRTRKVPVLGDLPFVGAASAARVQRGEERAGGPGDAAPGRSAGRATRCRNVLPGQETRSPDDFELFLEGILEAPRGPREVCQRPATCRPTRTARRRTCSPVRRSATGAAAADGYGGGTRRRATAAAPRRRAVAGRLCAGRRGRRPHRRRPVPARPRRRRRCPAGGDAAVPSDHAGQCGPGRGRRPSRRSAGGDARARRQPAGGSPGGRWRRPATPSDVPGGGAKRTSRPLALGELAAAPGCKRQPGENRRLGPAAVARLLEHRW